jgi:hypothetical protein
VKYGTTTLAILAALSASLALAEDFKTVNGKVYKDATVLREEPDGIVLKTKSGITKVYFTELPKDLQDRFHYDAARAAQFSAAQQTAALPPTVNRPIQAQTPKQEELASVQGNVRTIREVSTDQLNFFDQPFLLKGTINVAAYYNMGYREADRTHYCFGITDKTGSDCYAYMERERGGILHQQLIAAGGPLNGVFNVILLRSRFDRLAPPQLLVELLDYRLEQ